MFSKRFAKLFIALDDCLKKTIWQKEVSALTSENQHYLRKCNDVFYLWDLKF